MDAARRTAELQRLLVERPDPGERARVHLELGRLALDGRRVDLAIRHFREALLLDPRLDNARQALHALGEYSRVQVASPDRRGRLRQALGRFLGGREGAKR